MTDKPTNNIRRIDSAGRDVTDFPGLWGEEDTFVAPVHAVVMPLRVWRKMTVQEYAEQYGKLGKHVAVSQEIIEGCQEVWVFLGNLIRFEA